MMDPKTCTLLMSMAGLSFDYTLTFGQEVELVWSKPPSLGTLLFVLCRYLPFADLAIVINVFTAAHSIEGCYMRIVASSWIQLMGVCVSEVILTLRTIAIWKRNMYVMLGLGLLNTVAFACSIVFTLKYVQTVRPAQRLYSTGCYLAYVDKIVFGDFVVLLVCEIVVVVLTVMRALYYLRDSTASWVHQLYRKGILYFIVIMVFSLMNVLFPLLSRDSSQRLLFVDPQRAAHSIFCNRVLFLIFSQKQRGDYSTIHTSDSSKLSFFPTALEMALDTLATPDDGDGDTVADTAIREPEP